MITLHKSSWDSLRELAELANVYLEGNILKLIDDQGKEENSVYLQAALKKTKDAQRKRLQVSRDAQKEKRRLEEAQEINAQLMEELKGALEDAKKSEREAEEARENAEKHREEAEQAMQRAELAKETAEQNLDIFQKKQQSALMQSIVTVALAVVVGVGAITTILYIIALTNNTAESQITLLGNTWSNMFGILLTNSFSIIGTVMGVKYATSENGE
jgi:Fe2+ transport system protein B